MMPVTNYVLEKADDQANVTALPLRQLISAAKTASPQVPGTTTWQQGNI